MISICFILIISHVFNFLNFYVYKCHWISSFPCLFIQIYKKNHYNNKYDNDKIYNWKPVSQSGLLTMKFRNKLYHSTMQVSNFHNDKNQTYRNLSAMMPYEYWIIEHISFSKVGYQWGKNWQDTLKYTNWLTTKISCQRESTPIMEIHIKQLDYQHYGSIIFMKQ